MRAGTVISQKSMVLSVSVLVLCLGLWNVAVISQSVAPPPKFTAYDGNGDPCAGCLLYAYAAGTDTPQDTFTTYALSVANSNPVKLDTAGRATVFLNDTLSYKFTLSTANDVPIWTVDNIVGQLTGVITIAAANTRGLQITRASAEAGLSIASVGGSGKTWGFASTTTGELLIQDDADGSPKFQLGSGNVATISADSIVMSNAAATNSLTIATGGYVSAPRQPHFLAQATGTTSTNTGGVQAVDFATEVYDVGATHASASYTAPVTGVYHLCTAIRVTTDGAGAGANIYIVTTNRSYLIGQGATGATDQYVNACLDVDLDVSDAAYVAIQGVLGETIVVQSGWFSGRLTVS